MIDDNENEIIYFNKFETWHSMVTVVKAVGWGRLVDRDTFGRDVLLHHQC